LASLLLGGGIANAQKNAWPLFRPDATILNAQLGESSASWGTNFPKPMISGNPVTSYCAMNAATDVNGRLIFYVLTTLDRTYVYDKNNNIVNNWLGSSKEISVVTIDEGVRYHIIAGGKIKSYNLAKNEIIDEAEIATPGTELALGANTFKETVQAVRTFSSSSSCQEGYDAYFVLGNGNGAWDRTIVRLRYTKAKYGNDISENNFARTEYNITTATFGFNYYISEIDLSDDGSRLALADLHKIVVFSIDEDGDLELSNTVTSDYYNTNYALGVGGIEFVGNNKLLYSVFNAMEAEDEDIDEIRLWDFVEDETLVFDESHEYARSNIEKTSDGHYVVGAADGLYQLDPDDQTIASYLGSQTLYKNIDKFQHYRTTSGNAYYGIYNLPDQLDGQSNEILDFDEVVYNLNVNIGSGGTQTWTHASHPLTAKGSGRVLVLGAISLTGTSVPIVMENMELLFYTDAVLVASSANRITAKGCMFRAMSCSDMWKGIQIANSSRTNPEGYLRLEKYLPTDNYTRIQDAYKGLTYYGKNTALEITAAHFSKNERDLVIIGHTGNKVIIRNSYFTSLPLIDQERGSSNGHSDGKKRTINNIEIINSVVAMGSTAPGQNNTISAGQIGILSHESKLTLRYTEIHSAKKYAVDFNSNWKSHPELWVANCNIHNVFRGVVVYWGTSKTTFQSNSFSNTSGYAIEYKDNPRGDLLVGHASNSTLGNTFNNCNWQAIGCFNNNDFSKIGEDEIGSKIKIHNNTIDNHAYAGGVFVGEVTAADRSYKELWITRNNIGNSVRLTRGINLSHITGNNPDLPDHGKKFPYRKEFRIDTNYIKYNNSSFNWYSNGIYLERTSKINILNNDVQSATGGDYRTTALRIADGNRNLVWRNKFQGGVGGRIIGNAELSNLYCNELYLCVNGWQFESSRLRNRFNSGALSSNYDYMIHGSEIPWEDTFYARSNNFTPSNNHPITWGADITLYTKELSYHQWDFTFSTIPKIEYPYGHNSPGRTSIVHSVKRKYPCIESAPDNRTNDRQYQSIIDSGYTDTLLNWKVDYHDIQHYGDSIGALINAATLALVKIERALQQRNFSVADSLLQNYTPMRAWEEDFKTVYSIWSGIQQSGDTLIHLTIDSSFTDTVWISESSYAVDTFTRDTAWIQLIKHHINDSLVDILSSIASKSPTTASPAAYTARVILFAMNEMEFVDSIPVFYPSLTGILDSSCNWSSNPVRVDLFTSYGDSTGIYTFADDSGHYRIPGALLSTLDSSSQYYLASMLSNDIQYVSSTDYWFNLAYSSPVVFSCASIPLSVVKNSLTDQLKEIKIYPNPASTTLNIKGLPDKWLIEVYDISGKLAMSSEGKTKECTLDVSGLQAGLYIVEIINQTNKYGYEQKIIIE
jgi:hypothetical protein